MIPPAKKPRFSIHLAIQNGETEYIEKLMYYNHFPGDINALDDSGLSPLHVAILYKQEKIVELLLKNGADVNMMSSETTILMEVMEMLREPHSNPWCKIFDFDLYINLTPLHFATITGSLNIVRFLLENGANVNLENEQGLRPIHSAIHSENVEIVSLLFQNQAELDNCNKSNKVLGAEALTSCAADHGSTEIIKLLFQKGIKVKGTRAFQIAMERDHMDIVKELVRNCSIIDLADDDTYPPLYRLGVDDNYEMMQFLIDHGANVDGLADADFQETLLHRAARHGNLDLAKFMIKNGADLDSRSGPPSWGYDEDEFSEGSTPLEFAVCDGQLEIAELLIKAGANINISNAKAKTALHYAVERENGKMIQALIHNGANVEAWFDCEECEETYRTCAPKPLEIALEKKKVRGMKMFLYVNLHK